ncbi:MAG: hypothetical protein ACNS62_12795 [Candidatus Cyclobacteriaceae bacterium M3_2C_046]
MGKVDNVKEGFYFTDGEKILKITGGMPSRPDTFKAITSSDEEIKIKREKLYKIRLTDDWVKDMGFNMDDVIFQDQQLKVSLKKSGPSYYVEEIHLEENNSRRKTILAVDELQEYLINLDQDIPTIKGF